MIEKEKGSTFFSIAMTAFLGLGIEVLLGLFIEPIFLGFSINSMSVTESIIHWIITCTIWGLFSLKTKKISYYQYFIIALCVLFSLTISYINWNGFKIVKEFHSNGYLKFIFQYIYYIFETVLVLLIIIFSQKSGEIWFQKEKIPWGGITLALTWGLSHCLTKGDLLCGLITSLNGLLFGIVYLLTNKNPKIAYPLLLIMFIF